MPVETAVSVGRLAPAVEAAVYFVCSEALANVAKYAEATRVTIDVATADGHVVATIADDGVGGADSRGARVCVAWPTVSRPSAAGSGSKAHPEPARRSKPCSRQRSACARERLDREGEQRLAVWNSGERPGISVDVPAEDVGRPGRDPESLLPEIVTTSS